MNSSFFAFYSVLCCLNMDHTCLCFQGRKKLSWWNWFNEFELSFTFQRNQRLHLASTPVQRMHVAKLSWHYYLRKNNEINNQSTNNRSLRFYKTYKKKKKHNTITKACHTLCFFFVSLRNIYKQGYVQISITQKWEKLHNV